MQIENITNTQALLFVAGVIAFAWVFMRLIPGGGDEPQPKAYSKAEISAYDRQIPKYFLVAALSLTLGGLHTVVKNIPGFWQWLWQAGYGGHLFRDLSNSHIIIVGGGTLLLTGLTWYVLPRFTNRPLYSTSLAGISFWLTVVGVYGFYMSWLVLGIVEGSMVRHGWEYLAAKDALGNWHRIPTAITSSIMGFGYWAYVLNTFLTVFTTRRVSSKPLNYLTKFSAVSAGALFVGTVQGVIQVLPDNADWIRLAGKFGEYVDPISHAHINLVTGMAVSLAAFLAYFAPRMGGRDVPKRAANRIFWVLVPGSLVFYLAFLLLGLILGGAANGYGGIQASPAVVQFAGEHRAQILAIGGTLMLAGFWAYFLTLWRSLGLRSLGEKIRRGEPAGFWLASSIALLVGTFQGILQVIPATANILTVAEEVPNIHAQLNMIGGVILALLGVVFLLLPELIGQPVERRLQRLTLYGIGGGIAGYYLLTLTTGLIRWSLLRQGLTDVEAAARLGWVAPAALLVTALPVVIGYAAFAVGLWRITAAYRRDWREGIRSLPDRFNGQRPAWADRIPGPVYLIVEALGAFCGFPGIGWLLSGRALIGLPLALTGPAVAWAVVPLLWSPYGDGPLRALGYSASIMYLIATTLLSVTGLWLAESRLPHQLAEQKAGD